MNKTILTGNLTRDPKRVGQAIKFTLAAKGYKKDAFIPCTAFGKTADFIEQYFNKGMKANIEGHLQDGNYEKDGQKIYTLDVIVDNIEFGESKKKEEETDDSNLPFN